VLTSTYTLVVLSIEQASARVGLQALLERWQPDRGSAETAPACAALGAAFDSCYWRKLDRYVLPALRCTGVAPGLLAELDVLRLAAIEARADVHAAAAVQDPGFGAALARCCSLLLERLDREERELFPLARTQVPVEAWFAIANQMLAQVARQSEERGSGPPTLDASARSFPLKRPDAAPAQYASH